MLVDSFQSLCILYLIISFLFSFSLSLSLFCSLWLRRFCTFQYSCSAYAESIVWNSNINLTSDQLNDCCFYARAFDLCTVCIHFLRLWIFHYLLSFSIFQARKSLCNFSITLCQFNLKSEVIYYFLTFNDIIPFEWVIERTKALIECEKDKIIMHTHLTILNSYSTCNGCFPFRCNEKSRRGRRTKKHNNTISQIAVRFCTRTQYASETNKIELRIFVEAYSLRWISFGCRSN